MAHVARGDVPIPVRETFFGASLCALKKPDDGVRPIAVGLSLRRLSTKTLLTPLSGELGSHLRPTQLGYGTKGGCEAAVHAARHLLETSTEPIVLVKLDIKNAFNTIRRDKLMLEVESKIPTLYPYFHAAYSGHTRLFFGEDMIPSQTGLQQGDPGAPALFSLGIHNAISTLKSRLNMWYLDDGTLADHPDIVLEDIKKLIPDMEALGLDFNSSKCEIFTMNMRNEEEVLEKFKRVLPAIRQISHEELSLLGSPFTVQGAQKAITDRKAALDRMSDRLEKIDQHEAFTILRCALSLPKLLYLLRSSLAYKCTTALQDFDETMRRTLCKIVNIELPEDSWVQATLPIAMGGIGLRCATHVALPAFLASTASSSRLVRTLLESFDSAESDRWSEATTAWKALADTEAAPPNEEQICSQRSWDIPLAETFSAEQTNLPERGT